MKPKVKFMLKIKIIIKLHLFTYLCLLKVNIPEIKKIFLHDGRDISLLNIVAELLIVLIVNINMICKLQTDKIQLRFHHLIKVPPVVI